jgi:hypothetical protein
VSVAHLGRRLASELHARHLRPKGFRKHGGTFARQRKGYVELFGIQGSSFQSGVEPWICYLNVNVRFDDVPRPPAARRTPHAWHASSRIDQLVPGAPGSYEITSANLSEVADDLGRYIEAASAALPSLLPEALELARAGRSSFLTIHRPRGSPLSGDGAT